MAGPRGGDRGGSDRHQRAQGQRIDLAGLIGMGLIVAGVLVLNLFSKASAH